LAVAAQLIMPVQKVGAYDIFGTIGKGTFCKVKFAMNRETNTSVAVKILDKNKLRDASLLEATKNEIAIMKKIDSHTCVGIHDMFANPDKIIVVIDLVMGVSLHQVFKSKKRITEARARHFIGQIMEGLNYCHTTNIILGGKIVNVLIVSFCCQC
jgi:5'-AMP-activated protein kinase catalytic alpha subunit